MMTSIGIISGEILSLLEQRNGVFVFGDIQSYLDTTHETVMMSLGWLMGEGYIRIVEDPLRMGYQDRNSSDDNDCDVFMYDLIVDQRFSRISRNRGKNVEKRLDQVKKNILLLLSGQEEILALRNIEEIFNISRNILLMGLGSLIRNGWVQAIRGTNDIFVYRVSRSGRDEIDADLESATFSI